MRRLLVAAAAILGATAASALIAAPASADIITSSITVPNTALSGFPSPFGTVTIDLTSPTTANITFTANKVGTDQYLFIDSGAADVQVNATSWTESALTGTTLNGSFSGPQLTNAGSGTVDGFGVFNQRNNEFDGFNWALNTISFTLTDTSSTWASASQVLALNSSGFDAAAHIAVCDTSLGACSPSIAAVATGFAAEGPGISVPEPASLALLGSGLFGLGLIRRWRRKVARPTGTSPALG